MHILYDGHACVSVLGSLKIVVDPFITGSSLAVRSLSDIKADYILVTHAHNDHLGDTVQLAKLTKATVVTTVEVAAWLRKQGLSKVFGLNTGGSYTFPDGFRVKVTPAWHSSTLPDGTACGQPVGYLFWLDDMCFYHAGDTSLFSDMGNVIGKFADIDVAFLPIGSFYTMDAADAVIATDWLGPKIVMPIHYNTFPQIKTDPLLFKKDVESKTNSRCLVMAPGETAEVDL